ncbi:adenylate cyclase, partial [Rhizobium sullae]
EKASSLSFFTTPNAEFFRLSGSLRQLTTRE